MMSIIKRWRIILYFDLSNKSITFFIDEDHYSNMLRKLTEIGFDLDPTKIEISVQNAHNKKELKYNESWNDPK